MNTNLIPIDILKLSSVNPELVNSVINYKLKNYYSNLYKFLNNYCVISGSSLLQFLFNETWKDSDIDIFLTKTNFDILRKYLIESNYKEEDLSFSDEYKNSLMNDYKNNYKFKNAYNYKYSGISGIESLFNYYKGDEKIQLIICKDPLNSIKNFDFDFVKNYYNGFHLVVHKNTKHKVSFINSKVLSSKINKRIEKYTKRGFEIKKYTKK